MTPDDFRPLPHAVGPEKAVLSAIIKRDVDLNDLPEPVLPEMFFSRANRMLFEDFTAHRDTWELVTAATRLLDRGILDQIGGPSYLHEVYTYAPNGMHFATHFATVKNRWLRRMAIAAAQTAIESAFDCSEGDDSETFLSSLREPITAIFDAATNSTPKSGMKEHARTFLEIFERKIAGEPVEEGIPTGIPEIDAALHGMKPRHYGIISGRPSAGKSTLATQIFANQTDSLYLALERTESSIFSRCVVQAARIHHHAVSKPTAYAQAKGYDRPTKGDLTAIRSAVQKLANDSNLHLVKPSNRRLETICAEIRRHVRCHGVKTVFLDQIGLVRGFRHKGDSAEAELKGISNTLQELADELGFSLIVLCQENTEGDTKNAKAIEEDADWWLSIVTERDKKKENFGQHQHVLIAKDSHNCMGGTRLPLILDRQTLRFVHGYPSKPEDDTPRPRGRAFVA